MGTIRLNDVVKWFSGPAGKITAVNGVNLDISDGEFIVFVGPSGSGKSTILRMIAGLEDVTEGQIFINEEDVTTKRPKNRDIAMVFQNYALYPHLTARGNMEFGLKMQGGFSQEEIDDRIDRAADIMDIADILDKMPGDISGGQKQRVALGRAIVRNPIVFLMDEPLSNLDAKLRTEMRTEIQLLQEELGVTTIYVTHDQVEAMTMGDRIAILNDGELQQVSPPSVAYYEPNNRFVAGFIGSPSMNFLNVTVRQADDAVWLDHEAFSYELPAKATATIQSAGTDQLELGIRPEDIQMVEAGTQNGIDVPIQVIEPLGKQRLIHFTIGDDTYTASISDAVVPDATEEITVLFPPERIHLFDRASGITIYHGERPEQGVPGIPG